MLRSRIEKLQSRIYKIVGADGESVIFITVNSDNLMTACAGHSKGCPVLPCVLCKTCPKARRDTVTFIDDIGGDNE